MKTRKLTFSLGHFLVYCNFDAQSLCQFTQGTGDQFDWLLNKGTTSSAPDTGPSSDVSKTGQRLNDSLVQERFNTLFSSKFALKSSVSWDNKVQQLLRNIIVKLIEVHLRLKLFLKYVSKKRRLLLSTKHHKLKGF